MKHHRFPISGLLFALLLAALPLDVAQPAYADTMVKSVLRFGQTLALGDFDNDGSLDRARLASTGWHKTIEVQSGLVGSPSWLHFESSSLAQGSIFSQDLDNDGDLDLIWTDLLHADAVIVWLGDGEGRFERADAKEFAKDFTLGGFNVTQPEESQPEQASDDETNSPVELKVNDDCGQPRAPAIICHLYTQSVLPLGETQRTTGRSPPFLSI